MLYIQQGRRQSVGQGLEQRPVSSYYGLHHPQTHTCAPQSPRGTLWIPGKVRHRAYPATSPCIFLSPAASCTETRTDMCTCTRTHTNESPSWPWDPIISPGVGLDLLMPPVASSSSGLTHRHAHTQPRLMDTLILSSQATSTHPLLATSLAWYLLAMTHWCTKPYSLGLLAPQAHGAL